MRQGLTPDPNTYIIDATRVTPVAAWTANCRQRHECRHHRRCRRDRRCCSPPTTMSMSARRAAASAICDPTGSTRLIERAGRKDLALFRLRNAGKSRCPIVMHSAASFMPAAMLLLIALLVGRRRHRRRHRDRRMVAAAGAARDGACRGDARIGMAEGAHPALRASRRRRCWWRCCRHCSRCRANGVVVPAGRPRVDGRGPLSHAGVAALAPALEPGAHRDRGLPVVDVACAGRVPGGLAMPARQRAGWRRPWWRWPCSMWAFLPGRPATRYWPAPVPGFRCRLGGLLVNTNHQATACTIGMVLAVGLAMEARIRVARGETRPHAHWWYAGLCRHLPAGDATRHRTCRHGDRLACACGRVVADRRAARGRNRAQLARHRACAGSGRVRGRRRPCRDGLDGGGPARKSNHIMAGAAVSIGKQQAPFGSGVGGFVQSSSTGATVHVAGAVRQPRPQRIRTAVVRGRPGCWSWSWAGAARRIRVADLQAQGGRGWQCDPRRRLLRRHLCAVMAHSWAGLPVAHHHT